MALLKSSTTANPVDIYVGLQVRTIRQSLRMSQTSLAEACGITFQQIQKYERGHNRISASRLVQIASALDCGAVDLLPATGDDPGERKRDANAERFDRAASDRDFRTLGILWTKMTPESRKALVAIARCVTPGV